MRIAMIGLSDGRLGRLGSSLSKTTQLTCYEDLESLRGANEAYADAIVLCGGYTTLEALWEAGEQIHAGWPKAKLVLWFESNDPLLEHHESIRRYAISHGLHFWEPDPALESWEVLHQRLSSGDGSRPRAKRGSIVVFQGVTPNIGTTVACFTSAVRLSQDTSGEVAYVCLNLKSSKLHHYCGMEPAITLDSMRAELKSGALTTERLRSCCSRFPEAPRLSVLFGNQLREQAEYYMVEDIVLLLDRCRDAFDLTVVEVSAYWDNAAVFAAMKEADMRVLVCTDRLGSFQEDFRRSAMPMLGAVGVRPEAMELLVLQSGAKGYGVSAIRKQTGLQVIELLPYDAAMDSVLDQGRLQEFASTGDTAISKACRNVARLLAHAGHLPAIVKEEPTRKWWRRRWFAAAGRQT